MNANAKLRLIHAECRQEVESADPSSMCRVMFQGTHFETIHLEPVLSDALAANRAALQFPIPSFDGTLLDVGPDGIGIRVSQYEASQLLSFVHCRCELRLPLSREPMSLAVRVSHGRQMFDGSCYVGLDFEFEDELERRRSVQKIRRFASSLEGVPAPLQ